MKKLIYHAEDEDMVRTLVSLKLGRDYDIQAFIDGQQLYDAVLSKRPDAIITDGNMPQMRGYDVLKKLYAEGHNVPAIIFSTPSGGDFEDIEFLRKYGVEHVWKPNFREVEGLLKKIFPSADSTAA